MGTTLQIGLAMLLLVPINFPSYFVVIIYIFQNCKTQLYYYYCCTTTTNKLWGFPMDIC